MWWNTYTSFIENDQRSSEHSLPNVGIWAFIESNRIRGAYTRVYKPFVPLLPFFFHPHLSTSFRFRSTGRAWGHASAPTDPRTGTVEFIIHHTGGMVFSQQTYAIGTTSKNQPSANVPKNRPIILIVRVVQFIIVMRPVQLPIFYVTGMIVLS